MRAGYGSGEREGGKGCEYGRRDGGGRGEEERKSKRRGEKDERRERGGEEVCFEEKNHVIMRLHKVRSEWRLLSTHADRYRFRHATRLSVTVSASLLSTTMPNSLFVPSLIAGMIITVRISSHLFVLL